MVKAVITSDVVKNTYNSFAQLLPSLGELLCRRMVVASAVTAWLPAEHPLYVPINFTAAV